MQVGDDGQAQSYFNRASGLIHNCDDAESRLAYKLCNVRSSLFFPSDQEKIRHLTKRFHVCALCQARLLDFGRKFNEAALRYFELSWNTELAEEDRLQTLYDLSFSPFDSWSQAWRSPKGLTRFCALGDVNTRALTGQPPSSAASSPLPVLPVSAYSRHYTGTTAPHR